MLNIKKSDLRTGMKVTLRNGDNYIVLLNARHKYSNNKDILVGYHNYNICDWVVLDNYNEDLTYSNKERERFDIVKVEECEHLGELFTHRLKFSQPTKEMTLAEIEKELGYKIKIKEDK